MGYTIRPGKNNEVWGELLMSYEIIQDLTTINKGKKGTNKPEWIIFHFVGADGQALANAKYFKSVNRNASAHYFIDPNTIVQVVEDDTPAWHIGDGAKTKKGDHNGYVKTGGATNNNSIGIEHCQDVTTGKDVWNWDFHVETLNRSEWLIKKLQKKYNIDDDHVIRHYDASGKICPGNWQHDNWKKWWAFKERLHVGKVDIPKPATKPKEPTPGNKGIDTLAREVIAGKWGTGAERRRRLGDRYTEVQKRVNEILLGSTTQPKPTKGIETLAREVIAGKHGNGEARKKSLGNQYSAVQKRVNELTGSKPKPKGKSLATLVDEVNRGLHGDGEARKKSLGADYARVQGELNRIYSK